VAPDTIVSHAALDAAVHVQSRLVVIAIVPDMPADGAWPAVLSTLTSHLASVGDVTEMDEDDPVHALASTASAQSANSRARTARCGASSLPIDTAGVRASRYRSVRVTPPFSEMRICASSARISSTFPRSIVTGPVFPSIASSRIF